MNEYDIEFLIDCLKTGKPIPEEFKYHLFPSTQKEYELNYAGKTRKEDVLADNEEAMAVPLQTEKVFNEERKASSDDWRNLLIFGDNLQVLKTLYKDADEAIANKVKGQVKLIYIDPPFATERDFQTSTGAKAYSDKAKGAEFIEFLRKRLILAHEMLAPDGCIYVHLDWKKGHYAKLVLDEIFGENNFLNEIVWYYRRWNIASNIFARNHDVIFYYAKNKGQHTFNNLFIPKSAKSSAQGKAWKSIIGEDGIRRSVVSDEATKGVPMPDVWEISMINPVGAERKEVDYPTQKPEALLERILLASTKPGDLVMDFFAGSGTTLAVAEKMGRKWIGCDIGKLSIYTTQKRMLKIAKSKDLVNPKKKYDKEAAPFSVLASGLYDLNKVFALQKDEYVKFVKQLFEIDDSKAKTIGGITIDGKRRDFNVKIYPYWELKDASVDEQYVQELHKHIGSRIDTRFYIVAPANSVDFISDYHEIDGIRYYFLRVPYQIIKELHKVQFKKLRQPQSKQQVNDLDEAVGFHFIRQPEVKTELITDEDNVKINILNFDSAYSQDESGEKLEKFQSLAMVLVDLDYDGESFLVSQYYFAQELVKARHTEDNDDEEVSEELIKDELSNKTKISLEFAKSSCGKQIMAIYVDIYGNEFREILQVN